MEFNCKVQLPTSDLFVCPKCTRCPYVWISVAVYVLLQELENPDVIEPSVVGAEFTTGAEFSRIYGTYCEFYSLEWTEIP